MAPADPRQSRVSFKEVDTSAFIAETLRGFPDVEVSRPTPTSVLGVLHGRESGKTIALRADHDALPIREETGLEFASRTEGVAHACGHDTHAAMLLGTASVLSQMRDEIAGTVKLIFQHAEEQPPGGAREIIAAGVLDDVDAIFGLHVMNQKTGTINVAKGPASTSADGFWLTIHGRGSHGSMPQDGIDPVTVGSQLVLALNTIVSRSTDPSHTVVVNAGTFQAGEAPNVIPDSARLGVSIRTKLQDDRELVHRRVEEIVNGICQTYGATYDIDWILGYGIIHNDADLADIAVRAAAKALGDTNAAIGAGFSASEDFSFYTDKVPGCFITLGGGTADDGMPYQNHHPKFDVHETALANGTRTEVQIVRELLVG